MILFFSDLRHEKSLDFLGFLRIMVMLVPMLKMRTCMTIKINRAGTARLSKTISFHSSESMFVRGVGYLRFISRVFSIYPIHTCDGYQKTDFVIRWVQRRMVLKSHDWCKAWKTHDAIWSTHDVSLVQFLSIKHAVSGSLGALLTRFTAVVTCEPTDRLLNQECVVKYY